MPSITISNGSFESQNQSEGDYTYGGPGSGAIENWTITSGSGGVYDPRSSELSNVTGSDTAYLYDAGTAISQQVGHNYDHNHEISFSVDIGDPNYEDPQDFTLNIYAGSTLIGTTSGTTDGTDTLRTVTVTSTVFDASLNGQPITFEIVKVGNDNEEMHLDNVQASYDVICFTDGVKIATETGEVPVESLEVGDMVLTSDGAYHPIRWIGSRTFGQEELSAHSNLRPIRIEANALAPRVPKEDLVVSPQHRILVRSPIVERMTNAPEALVAAKKLVGTPGIFVDFSCKSVTYYNVLFDDHQVIWSNGAQSESFHLGAQALNTISSESLEEIATLFPEVMEPNFAPTLARPVLKKKGAVKNLIYRHTKNQMPLYQPEPCLPKLPVSGAFLNSC